MLVKIKRATKAAFKKAKLNLQKKSLGNVFKQLVAIDLGLGVYYKLTDDLVMIGHPSQIKKPSEVILDGFFMLVGRTVAFFVA